jgi:hypothetical protein
MKCYPSAVVVFPLLLLIASASGAAEDWRLAYYDKVDALFNTYDQKEGKLLKQYEPRALEFYAVFGPYKDAERKILRFEFSQQLKQNPKAINWSSTFEWAGVWDRDWNIIWARATQEQKKLAAEDLSYRLLLEEYWEKKAALHRAGDLTRIWDTSLKSIFRFFMILKRS